MGFKSLSLLSSLKYQLKSQLGSVSFSRVIAPDFFTDLGVGAWARFAGSSGSKKILCGQKLQKIPAKKPVRTKKWNYLYLYYY